MKLYHTYEKGRGFDLDKQDFERGIFTIKPWWKDKPGYEKYDEWEPNEFGDSVVEINVDDNVKTYTIDDQIDAIIALYGKDNPIVQKILHKYDTGDFEREDWHKLDAAIGKALRKKGYKLIYYTTSDMYGEEWAIIDRSAIKSIKFSPK